MFEFVSRSREWVRSSIKRRLLFSSLIFWVISVFVIGITFLVVGQTQVKHDARIRNVQTASVVGRDVNSQLSAIFADTRVLARHLELRGPDSEAQAEAILAFRLSSPQRYRAAYCFNEAGELCLYLTETLEGLFQITDVATLVSRPPVEVNQTITLASVMATQHGLFISEIYFSELNRMPMLCLGLPVVFSTQQHYVVVLEIDLQDIWQRLDQITIGKTGFTYAVSGQGAIISHPQVACLGEKADPEIGALLTGYEGYSEYRNEAREGTVLAAYSPVGGSTGWGIVVQQDVAEVNATVFRAGLIIVSIWIVLAVIGTLGILFFVNNFTHPIAVLTATTRTISQTGKLRGTGIEQRTDEIGELSYAFDQMIERLQTSESRLAHVAAEERNRLARDLHDAVSQTLFSASIIAEVLPRLWEKNPAEGRRRLEEIRQLTRGALAEMRTLLFELRPSALADAELGYLLRQLVESFMGRQRIPVEVEVEETCQIPARVKVALYRIAQEALNNVAKHSSAAGVRVSLKCLPREVTLSIADDGRGFDASHVHAESLGLGIMQDRARDIGALLSVQSQPGKGVQVLARWKKEDQEECYE